MFAQQLKLMLLRVLHLEAKPEIKSKSSIKTRFPAKLTSRITLLNFSVFVNTLIPLLPISVKLESIFFKFTHFSTINDNISAPSSPK